MNIKELRKDIKLYKTNLSIIAVLAIGIILAYIIFGFSVFVLSLWIVFMVFYIISRRNAKKINVTLKEEYGITRKIFRKQLIEIVKYFDDTEASDELIKKNIDQFVQDNLMN